MKIVNTERIPIKNWLDEIEEGTLEQAKNLANLPFAFKHVAIMPNANKGYGMPIGGVLATQDAIVPNATGSDIGCGCLVVQTSLSEIDSDLLERIVMDIREVVPVGFGRHQQGQRWEGFEIAPDNPVVLNELGAARYYLGTLGKHFIEIQQGSDGHIWILLHSGSRSLGEKVVHKYHRKAVDLCKKWHSNVSTEDLSFLPIDSQEGRNYFMAMKFCLTFAAANRALMMDKVLELLNQYTGAEKLSEIDIPHNYAAAERHFGQNVMVHRNGAIGARTGQIGVISGTMGTKSFIVRGLGNSESFQSCSHGAGRRLGRKQAQRDLNLAEEQVMMVGIIHRPLTIQDLGEAPGAYRDIEMVMENQRDLVEIEIELKPLAVIKG